MQPEKQRRIQMEEWGRNGRKPVMSRKKEKKTDDRIPKGNCRQGTVWIKTVNIDRN
jgi:hypothetical protein